MFDLIYMYKNRKSGIIMSDASNEFLINYRTIFESSPDAVIITQSDGSILYANSAAEKLFGYTQGKFVNLEDPE